MYHLNPASEPGTRLYRMLSYLISGMPWPIIQAVGTGFGVLAWCLAGSRRSHVIRELRRYKHHVVSDKEWDTSGFNNCIFLSLRIFICFGKSLLEIFALSGLSREQIRNLCPLKGVENLEKALRKGRGALLFTGHFGCWELLGASIAAHDVKMLTIVQRQSNLSFDRWLVNQRKKLGLATIYRGQSLRPVISWLKQNKVFSILMDQDAREQGVFVPFLGKPASTPPGAASLALRYDVPVLPLVSYRRHDGRHQGYILPEINIDMYRINRRPSRAEITGATARMTRIIESFVRHRPSNWLWLHKRHKSKPENTVAVKNVPSGHDVTGDRNRD